MIYLAAGFDGFFFDAGLLFSAVPAFFPGSVFFPGCRSPSLPGISSYRISLFQLASFASGSAGSAGFSGSSFNKQVKLVKDIIPVSDFFNIADINLFLVILG